jgi:hypothetical protein
MLGIRDIIETNVLERQAKFDDMQASDPRYLAMDWLMYEDKRHDINLIQRYILALVAFSFDLFTWKNCGIWDKAESYIETDVVGNYALWLFESDECLWYGETCNSHGVVEDLELSKYVIKFCFRYCFD